LVVGCKPCGSIFIVSLRRLEIYAAPSTQVAGPPPRER
jgi:hypothetical protein